MSSENILIDVSRLANRALRGRLPSGVDRVSLAYIEHFRRDAHALVRYAGRWVVLNAGDSQRVFDALLGNGARGAATIRWCVGRAYVFSWHVRRGKLLFNTGHSGLDGDDYVREVTRSGLQPLFFLHDLIPISHPEYCRPGEAEKHHRRLDTMLSVGRGVIVNSKATHDDLMAYAVQRGLKTPPCVVAPLAPTRLPAPGRDRPLEAPYFVILGTIEPRKNHLLLLHLWRQLVDELGAAAPKLVVIGHRGWECEQVVDLLDRCEALKGVVIERQRCGDAELATWLHHARALLFPSFIEGFGIPVVEALMLGVPVIASDLPVFYEIAGAIPEYLDPLDGPGWKRAILDYAQADSSRHRAQIERMKGYSPPTWERHFAIVEEMMQALDDNA